MARDIAGRWHRPAPCCRGATRSQVWRNSIEGAAPLAGAYDTKAEAVEAGRAEAQRRQTEHLIHNEDGEIAERNSYGNDPADRPG